MKNIYNKHIDKPWIIAGPCSAESQEQILQIAKEVQYSANVFRAGVWKPRTRPNSFQGMGKRALKWLKVVKEEVGIPVAVEVANSEHVEECLKSGVDVLWLGARTTVNPFYVQEIADSLKGVKIPVLVKNPLHPELSLWLGALERLDKSGVTQLSAIHRGFYTQEQSAFRNEPKWEVPIELKRICPNLPIICDPSHISGNTDLIQEVSQTAMDLNMDGLMIETHCNPEKAYSDSKQQLKPNQLKKTLKSLVYRSVSAPDVSFNKQLNQLRKAIDVIDVKLLEVLKQRTSLVEEIGQYKKNNGVTILQIDRWFEILQTRQDIGLLQELDVKMVAELFKLIHKHSILIQTEIMKNSS